MKLLQTRGHGVDVRGGHVEEHHVARFQHVQVAQHASLRRQPRGVTAAAGGERRRVVGQKSVQKGGAIRARDGNLATRRNSPDGGAFMKSCVIVG